MTDDSDYNKNHSVYYIRSREKIPGEEEYAMIKIPKFTNDELSDENGPMEIEKGIGKINSELVFKS